MTTINRKRCSGWGVRGRTHTPLSLKNQVIDSEKKKDGKQMARKAVLEEEEWRRGR
jgi:hypothetical protein